MGSQAIEGGSGSEGGRLVMWEHGYDVAFMEVNVLHVRADHGERSDWFAVSEGSEED